MSAVLKEVSATHQIMMVPKERCAHEWPSVYGLLEPAVVRSHGRWEMGDLLTALCFGDQHLWIIRNETDDLIGAMTTQIVDYPSARFLAVHFLGGEKFNQWSHAALNILERFAADMDCDGLEAVARFGFAPFFKERGYGKSYCTYDRVFHEVKDDG